MITVLHLSSENKFIESGLALFETIDSVKNKVVIVDLSNNGNKENIKINKLKLIIYNQKNLYSYLKNSSYDLVVFHSMKDCFYNAIKYIDIKIPKIWISWGFDLYRDISDDNFRLPIQIALYKKQTYYEYKNNTKSIKRDVKKYFSFFYRLYTHFVYRRFVININYCSTVLENEFILLKNKKPFNAKYFHFSYALSTTTIKNCLSLKKGNKVMIGNSASYTNNHLDIFSIILSLKIKNKLIIPISYGDEQYSKLIELKAREFFGDKCVCLKSFLPLSEYMSTLSECGYLLIGALRQQAIGNIELAFLQGLKVFLYERSIMYSYYKSKGFVVFSIEDLASGSELLDPLSKEEVKTNRYKVLLLRKNIIRNFKIDMNTIINCIDSNKN